MIASIASLLLVLTLWSGLESSAAEAAQIASPCAMVAETAIGHAPGDADDTFDGNDKAAAHHHNINHAHELGVPVGDGPSILLATCAVRLGIPPSAPPLVFAPDQNLRPPIA